MRRSDNDWIVPRTRGISSVSATNYALGMNCDGGSHSVLVFFRAVELWKLQLVGFLTLVVQLLTSTPAQSAICSSLAALHLAKTTIASGEIVAAGAFQLPPGGLRADSSFFTAFETLGAFCRVRGVITPAIDSRIEFEVWMPVSGWNGNYIGAGNGGFSGSINYYRLGEAVHAGYVASATDIGHKDSESRWWDGHPEKVIDFDYRGIHETALRTKAVIEAFYGRLQAHAYFISCSNGGRQGLVEAQKYPADYDGVLAGAPAYSFGAILGGHGAFSLNWSAPDF